MPTERPHLQRIVLGLYFVWLLRLTQPVSAAGAAGAGPPMPPGQDLLPAAVATRTNGSVHIDGMLDEPVWRETPPIGPLVQIEPNEGRPATDETEVRVLFDSEALYFGIFCRDRTPSAIVSTQLTRDANLEIDDNIFIILDPFFDHRNGFFFQVNPAGARADGQIANNAERWTRDWDGIWQAAARITDEGWTAEIEVPFKTLRFKPGQAVWGFNIERHSKRRNETDRWAGARQDIWIANLAQAGRLEGMTDIRQGRGLDIRPYVSGGEENRGGEFTGGLDVFKNLRPNLNASLSINTDFAETEADIRQVNLTRFPLFFPEKRAFFLEGAGVFDVAGGGGTEVIPLFTRRVGLLENEQIPVLAGAKVVGREGSYNVGFLDVQTRDTTSFPNAGQNLLAARVSRNVFHESFVGAIVTHGSPAGTGADTLVGADAKFSTSSFRGNKNLIVDMSVMRTDDQASGTTDYAAMGHLDYPNDLCWTSRREPSSCSTRSGCSGWYSPGWHSPRWYSPPMAVPCVGVSTGPGGPPGVPSRGLTTDAIVPTRGR